MGDAGRLHPADRRALRAAVRQELLPMELHPPFSLYCHRGLRARRPLHVLLRGLLWGPGTQRGVGRWPPWGILRRGYVPVRHSGQASLPSRMAPWRLGRLPLHLPRAPHAAS